MREKRGVYKGDRIQGVGELVGRKSRGRSTGCGAGAPAPHKLKP